MDYLVFEFEEVNYGNDILDEAIEELQNASITAFLNNWNADIEDASDGAVFNALLY
jgi:uncharacterized protein YjgD (DUF1641 family)